jgi:hypothetical protein
LQDIFVDLWSHLAERYGKYRDMLMLELLNEVTSKEFTEIWNKMAARAIKAIREKDKDVRIVVGGIFNDSIYGLTLLDPPADENIVFTFHCYSPLAFTHQGAFWVDRMPRDPEKWKFAYPGTVAAYKARSEEFFGHDFDSEYPDTLPEQMGVAYFENLMQPALEVAEKYNVPLYCGEHGVIDLADKEDAVRWIKDIHTTFHKYGIGSALWNYKGLNYGISDLQNVKIKDALREVL